MKIKCKWPCSSNNHQTFFFSPYSVFALEKVSGLETIKKKSGWILPVFPDMSSGRSHWPWLWSLSCRDISSLVLEVRKQSWADSSAVALPAGKLLCSQSPEWPKESVALLEQAWQIRHCLNSSFVQHNHLAPPWFQQGTINGDIYSSGKSMVCLNFDVGLGDREGACHHLPGEINLRPVILTEVGLFGGFRGTFRNPGLSQPTR